MIVTKQTNYRHTRRQTWHDWVSWQALILQSCNKLHQIKTCKCKGLHVWMPWATANISVGAPPPSGLLLADGAEEVLIRIMLHHRFHTLGARGNCKITGDKFPHQGFHLLEGPCKWCTGGQRLEHLGLDGPFFMTSVITITWHRMNTASGW